MLKESRQKVEDITGLFAAIIALLALIRQFSTDYKDLTASIARNWPWYAVPAVVLLCIAFWRRDRLRGLLAPQPVVQKREAFHIGRKYLLGREAAIDDLLHCLAEWPLVFLVGESGAGKSSLLERGVLPKLREDPGVLPLYMDTWGADWVEGPRSALSRALNASLDDATRKRLGLSGPISSSEAVRVLARLPLVTGQQPLLLFDQFDDYQTRHRARFLDGPQRTLLNAAELVARNSFWKEISDLLLSSSVRVLITIRADAKVGLESVRFTEPKIYLLFPLERSVAADLLDTISKDAVQNPERGFDRLKERLLDDLAVDGWVLPIQMQTAFRGLAELRAMTPGEYERQGGLTGLEALYLDRQITAAARAMDWSVAEIRTILLAMVDRSSRKTVPQSMQQLLETLPPEKRELTRLAEVLERLESAEVVRQRIEPGREEGVWQLDHDYLSRGLLELDQRARRWPLLLGDSARAFEGARGLAERWKKLLPPSIQLRLLYERFRSRLRYRPYAAYAGLSSLRLVLNTWVVVFILAAWSWNTLGTQREAVRLFAVFGEEEMTRGEFRALWELATANPRIRRAFLETAFEPENVRYFAERSEQAMRAIVGLDPNAREDIANAVFLAHCMKVNELIEIDSAVPCSYLAITVNPFDDKWGRRLLTDMRATSEPIRLRALAQGLGVVGATLPPEEISSASHILLDHYCSAPSWLLFDGLKSIFSVLPAKEAADVWKFLMGKPCNNTYQWPFNSAELAKRIGPSDADTAWEQLLTARQETNLHPEALVILAKHVTSPLPYWKDLLRTTPVPIDYGDRATLMVLQGHFSPSDAKSAALMVTRDPAIRRLGVEVDIMLAKLGPRMTPQDAREIAPEVFDLASNRPLMPRSLGYFASLLDSNHQARAMQLLSDEPFSASQVVGLFGLRKTLTQKDAREAWDRLIDNLPQLLSAETDDQFFVSLAGLSDLLSMTDVIDISDQLSAGEHGYDSRFFIKAECLMTLGSRLPQGRLMAILHAAVKRSQFEDYRAARIISGLSPRLSDPEAELILRSLLKSASYNRSPRCSMAAPLIRRQTIDAAIELLKWPTCSQQDRDLLIARVGELTGKSFTTKDASGTPRIDPWKFAEWAKQQGYPVAKPPALPPLDEM